MGQLNIDLNGFLSVFLKRKRIRLVCEKLIIFPYGNISSESFLNAIFKNVLCYEIEVDI